MRALTAPAIRLAATTVTGMLALALLTPTVARGDTPLLAAHTTASPRSPEPPPFGSGPSTAPGPAPLEVKPPSRSYGAIVARIVAPAFARTRLASPKRGSRVRPQTAWSSRAQVLLVLDAATRGGEQFVKVLLAERPNGSTGWIPRDNVVLEHTPHWIEVRTHDRRVTVYREGRRVRRMRAVVGTAGTPTPRGLGAVYERNRQPDPRGFLGPWVLSLTMHSKVLQSFDGGTGRVGIHGRGGASFHDPLGSASSHGCIRIANRHIRWMARHIAAGTPVRVRR